MKGQAHSPKQAAALAMEQPYAVNYRWTDAEGVRCSGRSVAMGRDRAHAERRFFRQHRHVSPVDADELTQDTI